jgi:hypothetical protein
MAFSTAACDKVYHARIDVGPFSAEAKGAAPLTAQEREQAVSVFSSVAHRLGLSCRPGEFPIVSGSYDEAQYRLTECDKAYTQVQLAVASGHVSVEIFKIGGMGEPPVFRDCRTQLADALVNALPKGRVTVRYPYSPSGG